MSVPPSNRNLLSALEVCSAPCWQRAMQAQHVGATAGSMPRWVFRSGFSEGAGRWTRRAAHLAGGLRWTTRATGNSAHQCLPAELQVHYKAPFTKHLQALMPVLLIAASSRDRHTQWHVWCGGLCVEPPGCSSRALLGRRCRTPPGSAAPPARPLAAAPPLPPAESRHNSFRTCNIVFRPHLESFKYSAVPSGCAAGRAPGTPVVLQWPMWVPAGDAKNQARDSLRLEMGSCWQILGYGIGSIVIGLCSICCATAHHCSEGI